MSRELQYIDHNVLCMVYESLSSFFIKQNDMNTIFKYNVSAKYSTKDLKGGYNNHNFSLLNIYPDEKGPSVKIQPPNIFNDHHIVVKSRPTTVGYN